MGNSAGARPYGTCGAQARAGRGLGQAAELSKGPILSLPGSILALGSTCLLSSSQCSPLTLATGQTGVGPVSLINGQLVMALVLTTRNGLSRHFWRQWASVGTQCLSAWGPCLIHQPSHSRSIPAHAEAGLACCTITPPSILLPLHWNPNAMIIDSGMGLALICVLLSPVSCPHCPLATPVSCVHLCSDFTYPLPSPVTCLHKSITFTCLLSSPIACLAYSLPLPISCPHMCPDITGPPHSPKPCSHLSPALNCPPQSLGSSLQRARDMAQEIPVCHRILWALNNKPGHFHF